MYKKPETIRDGSWTGQPEGPWVDGAPLPCGCPQPWPKIFGQCSLNKPLLMVIPPGGVHISCPVHSEGHHIYGSTTHC